MELLRSVIVPLLNGTIDNYLEEPQNSDYESFIFNVNDISFRNRLAKKTPTKNGYFIVFWERDNNKNQAFDFTKSPDFLVINVLDTEHKGFFIFPKGVLLKQNILRTSQKKAKWQ